MNATKLTHAVLFPFLLAVGAHASPPLPALDLAVTKYLGTTGAEQVMLNRTTPNSATHLGGIHVDTSKTPNRFYAFDSGNNRILGFHGWRGPNPDGSFPPADLVIGQPAGWDFGAANGHNTQFLQPTAETLALIPYPFVASTAESPRSATLATDAEGSLYVPDPDNNRVLKFIDPFATDSIADEVWGQATFTTRALAPTPSATSLNLQWKDPGVYGAGVHIDPAGNLWVTDSGNHRVLRFPKQGSVIAKTADVVIGQPDFTAATSGTALDQLYKPHAVRVHPQTGELFVLDGESLNYGGPCRLLVYAPPFTNGMSAIRELGKITSDQASGLFNARGFVFDPADSNAVWVADGFNRRLLKLHTQTGAKLDVIGRPDFTLDQHPRYVGFDGQTVTLASIDGEIAFDLAGNLYFTCPGGTTGIVRVPFPLRRDGAGYVISDSEMLRRGWNTISGRTMQDHFGLARHGTQLYVCDHPRLLVWNDAAAAANFAPADFVVGQESLDVKVPGGTFEGQDVGYAHAAGGRLFTAVNDKIYVFAAPITSGGRDYPPLKKIVSSTSDLTWADDNSPVPFQCTGLVYDPARNALWISDHPRNRILRVADPLGAAPKVNLVLGQATKAGSEDNHGLGFTTTDARGFAGPSWMALDNFGNLYAVDSSFEGAANRRVLRFDAGSLVPVPGNIFPDPAASGVFCKPTLTTNRDYFDDHRPNFPTHLAFDSQNRMILLCDSYGNAQGERAYWYPTPHLGTAPQPSHMLTTAFGQAGFAYFDSADRLLIQDHTWNRVLFYAPGSTAPNVAITACPAIAGAGAASVAIAGSCNAQVTGVLTWTTDGGATGTIPAAATWTIPAVPLKASGPTVVSVSGANGGGTLASVARTISREVLAAPAIVPEGGARVGPLAVSLHHFRSGVTLRYTLDGSDPTASSPVYSAPLLLTSSGTLKTRAFLGGTLTSPVSAATYALVVATPGITPPGAAFGNSVSVNLATATPEAQVRFTLDGSAPTPGSTPYRGPLLLDFTTVLKARAFRAGFAPSEIAAATFVRSGTPAATPLISPPGGHFTGSTLASLTSTTPGAEIRYTLSGHDVFGSDALYGSALPVSGSVVLKARAYAPGLAPSGQATAVFHLRSSWESTGLPAGTPDRDRRTALGSDGAFLYFTAGQSANAPLARLPKGETSWLARAALPLPSATGGVGDLAFFNGSLYTHALHSNGSFQRTVYRYDISGDAWTRGAPIVGDGADAACVVLASDYILGGWIGWTRLVRVNDPLSPTRIDIGDLSGGASHPWDGCAGETDAWFVKHHNTAANAGVLGRIGRTGVPAIFEVAGMPFNPGMGCAVECIPGALFADGHERLFILRGGIGSGDNDGASWATDANANQLAIYDVAAGTWQIETLPFAVGEGSEMALVGDTLYILASRNVASQPLRSFRFLPKLAPIEQWRLIHFGSAAGVGSAANLADPDGDGLNNLGEFGLSGNPWLSSAEALPTVGADAARLAITFTRNLDASDTTWRVLAADQPGGPWSALATKAGDAPWSLFPGAIVTDPGSGPVSVRDYKNIADELSRFLRIEISQ